MRYKLVPAALQYTHSISARLQQRVTFVTIPSRTLLYLVTSQIYPIFPNRLVYYFQTMTSLGRYASDIPMRPIGDKEMEIVDLDLLFEDYVETDLLHQLSNPMSDRSSSVDLVHLFDFPSSTDSDVPATSPSLNREEDYSWQKALHHGAQNPALAMPIDSSSFYVESRGKESLSDSELLSFEDLFEVEQNQLRSISQPSTPRPHHAKAVKKAVSFQEKSLPRGIQKLTKRNSASSFAKMMQPSTYYRAPIPDVWTRKMDSTDAFSLRAASHNITSPPSSAKILHHENGSGFFTQVSQPYNSDSSPLTSPQPNTHEMTFTNYQLTPQASPALGISNENNDPFNDNMGLTFSSSSSSAALSALQTPPSSMRLPMTTWGPDTSPSMEYAFSASPGFNNTKTAGWWNDDNLHSGGGPTYPESNSRSTSHMRTDSMAGLGITCDNTSFGDFTGLGISGAEQMGAPTATASPYEMGHYSNMYPTPPHHNIVSIGQRLSSRSPSPTPQPRFHRRRPSTQASSNHRATSGSRRKSTTGGHSRQASGGSGGVGFVNFTPDDSRKILTGVAPSGSSKTKARREKEAAEKRRKLSQAAMKAVMEAGGDVDSLRRLEREGLLVLES